MFTCYLAIYLLKAVSSGPSNVRPPHISGHASMQWGSTLGFVRARPPGAHTGLQTSRQPDLIGLQMSLQTDAQSFPPLCYLST